MGKTELLNQANIIRQETNKRANDAERIGKMFTDIIGFIPTNPQIKTIAPISFDAYNSSEEEGFYYVVQDGRLVGMLQVFSRSNYGNVIQQVLTACVKVTANGYEFNDQYPLVTLQRTSDQTEDVWSNWVQVANNLRTVAISDIDSIDTQFGSYDVVASLESHMVIGFLTCSFAILYESQYAVGSFMLNNGSLVMNPNGGIKSFSRRRKYKGTSGFDEWEPWEKKDVDLSPYVKSVEWSGETVTGVDVLAMSTINPGTPVLLVNANDEGIAFVYKVANSFGNVDYYGNWEGLTEYQDNAYASGAMHFIAGFFAKTLYISPDSIWMVNDDEKLVKKTGGAESIEIPQDGYIDTDVSQIDNLKTPGMHYRYLETETLGVENRVYTVFMGVYQQKMTSLQTNYTAIVQRKTRISYGSTGKVSVKKYYRAGNYTTSPDQLTWSAWFEEKSGDVKAVNLPSNIIDPSTLKVNGDREATQIVFDLKNVSDGSKTTNQFYGIPMSSRSSAGTITAKQFQKLDDLKETNINIDIGSLHIGEFTREGWGFSFDELYAELHKGNLLAFTINNYSGIFNATKYYEQTGKHVIELGCAYVKDEIDRNNPKLYYSYVMMEKDTSTEVSSITRLNLNVAVDVSLQEKVTALEAEINTLKEAIAAK